MTNIGGDGIGLWDEADEFFYDVLQPARRRAHAAARALDGRADPALRGGGARARAFEQACPASPRRLSWFLRNRPDLAQLVSRWTRAGQGHARLAVAAARPPHEGAAAPDARRDGVPLRLRRAGALASATQTQPFELRAATACGCSVRYVPGRIEPGLFGGNSNWRGPVWMPVNYPADRGAATIPRLLRRRLQVECPTGSGQLHDPARGRRRALAAAWRASSCAAPTGAGRCFGDTRAPAGRPAFPRPSPVPRVFPRRQRPGLGASHQTGWTGLVALLLQPRVEPDGQPDGRRGDARDAGPGTSPLRREAARP